MKRLSFVLLVSLLMASVANGAWYWLGPNSVDSSWANTNNWHDGTVSPPATIPHGATESMRISQGTVNADMDDTMGYIMMSRADGDPNIPPVGNVTLNLNSGRTLNVSTGSSELVSVAYSNNVTNDLNVSSGRLNVWRGNAAGELRLNHIYEPTCVGNLRLSGGVVDTEILNRGERNGGGTFYGTGGTLVIRDEIDKFDFVSNGKGFNLGGSTLEIAPVGSAIGEDYVGAIGKIEIGNSQDTDFTMTSSSTVVFDLGDPDGVGGDGVDWDHILTEGDWVLAGTLVVNFVGYTPSYGDSWEVWDTDAGDAAIYTGSGMFASLPADIQASLINGGDTLELTYIPEPATLVLLGLGSLVALRRKK